MTPSRQRLDRARAVLRQRAIDALLVGPSADLIYLVGYRAPPLERLTLLVVPAHGDATLVVPELEAPRALASGAAEVADLLTWGEQEDPVALVVRTALADTSGAARAFALQDRLWTAFTLRLQAALPGATWLTGSTVMRELRLVKDDAEIAALRQAAAAIDSVHTRVPGLLAPGRSEAEVGRDIAELILEDHDEVRFVIVGSGPNGASPHHDTGQRRIARGDAVVVDIGGSRAGYCSDATRNYVVGAAPDGYDEVHAVVLAAQQAGIDAVRPGATAAEVDHAARQVIDDAGYGRWFVHRTGHGIGLEEHEEPWIVAGNDLPLAAGMSFSVEPGIYLPDRFGVRIEDIVAVTDDGAERLNLLPREAVTVTTA